VPIETGSDDAEWTSLDRLSMAQWLTEQGFTSPRLKWMADYACRDDYGAMSEQISAWAGLWYFCASAPRSPRARLFETAGVRVPCLSRTPLPRAHAPPQRSLGF
jgi:hypothetical protein